MCFYAKNGQSVSSGGQQCRPIYVEVDTWPDAHQPQVGVMDVEVTGLVAKPKKLRLPPDQKRGSSKAKKTAMTNIQCELHRAPHAPPTKQFPNVCRLAVNVLNCACGGETCAVQGAKEAGPVRAGKSSQERRLASGEHIHILLPFPLFF